MWTHPLSVVVMPHRTGEVFLHSLGFASYRSHEHAPISSDGAAPACSAGAILRGVSGCKESRPALNRLMSGACRRRFDAVLVWKIDRFGRSLKHLVNTLADLAGLGVAFISLRDNLDLSTPSGRLMFQIIGAMAEFEKALIQERVKAGLRNAQAKGRRLGRPRVIVDVSRISALRAEGHSWAEIKAKMGVSKGTAQRAFARVSAS